MGFNLAYQERISYDANGNILTCRRNGDSSRLSMDELSYFYKQGTNQLQKVTDAAQDATAFCWLAYHKGAIAKITFIVAFPVISDGKKGAHIVPGRPG